MTPIVRSLQCVYCIIVSLVCIWPAYSQTYSGTSGNMVTTVSTGIAASENTNIDVQGTKQTSHILLNWMMNDPNQYHQFDIERNSGGTTFVTVRTVSASATTSRYVFRDQEFQNGNNFYRIKVTAKTGAVSYSKVITVDAGATSGPLVLTTGYIFTNEIAGVFEMVEKEPVSIRLYNNEGKLVKKMNYGGAPGRAHFDLSGLARLPYGLYTLMIKSKNREITERVMKI